jgi:hypothetical protein
VGPLILALTIGLHLALPLLLIIGVATVKSGSRLQWGTDVLLTAALLVLLHVAGAGWAMFGMVWRSALWAAFVLALLLSIRRVARWAWLPTGTFRGWLRWLMSALGLLLLGSSLPAVIGAHQHDEAHVDLAFPLRGGEFHVLQGGATELVNAHHAVTAQRYALDIVALHESGRRAHGLAPQAREAYATWRKPVWSPCAGEVLATCDDLDDQPLTTSDSENPAGNHVVLHCRGVTVMLAHLRRGSVAVRAGSEVVSGQQLAEAGNSGNSSEPHLHIHAVRGRQTAFEMVAWDGLALPMHFDGRFLARNDVVVVE